MSQALYGWRDLRTSLTGLEPPPATAPTQTAFGPSGLLKRPAFAVGDYLEFDLHVDHDYWVDSDAFLHVHWSTNGTSVNSVKWEISYTLAKGHDQANFPAQQLITIEQAAAGTAWRHMITEDGTGISLEEPDTLLLGRITRITNGGTDNADAVFGLFVDFHYQTMQYATPYRIPNFYTGP